MKILRKFLGVDPGNRVKTGKLVALVLMFPVPIALGISTSTLDPDVVFKVVWIGFGFLGSGSFLHIWRKTFREEKGRTKILD